MNTKTALYISFIFHPVFLLSYVTLILVFSPSFVDVSQTILQKISTFCFILLFATIFPCLLMVVLKHFKKIETFEMQTSRERLIPYIFNCLIYIVVFLFLYHHSYNLWLTVFFGGMLVLQLLILIINFFWKISIHATGLGAITGLFLNIALTYNSSLWFYSLFCIVLSFLVIFARLKLKAHTNMQTLIGWLLGFLIMFNSVFFIPTPIS